MIRMNRGTIMIMTTITSMNMVTDIIMSMTTTTATTIIMSMTTTTAMTIITITTTTTAMTIIMITITVLIIMNMIIMVIRTRILECMRSSISYGICICRKRWKGTMDAVADVTAVCFLLDRLSADEIVCSPVHVGCGEVHCAHGILPVPAPATANILKGIPIYSDGTRGELTTPTGAALLKHFVNRFEAMPPMTVDSIGYGMGTKDFGKANCVRLLLGKTGQQTAASGMTGEPNENSLPDEVKELASDQDNLKDQVTELACNLDDMTAEGIGFAMDCLLEAGALDVYTIAINMKKNRPGTMLCVLTKEEKKEEMIRLLFKHTTTIGIRETMMHRSILKRETETIHTPCGTVRCKKVSGYGTGRQKLEYEDLARIAREQNLSLSDVRMLVETAKAED